MKVDLPFKGKRVIFDKVTPEQKELLDHYYELVTGFPRKGATLENKDREILKAIKHDTLETN